MTLINKIREYIFNVSAYPECTDTIEIKQFLEFLKELEKEQEPPLSPETIEVIRELFKTHEYNYHWGREKYEQAQKEFNKVYGDLK